MVQRLVTKEEKKVKVDMETGSPTRLITPLSPCLSWSVRDGVSSIHRFLFNTLTRLVVKVTYFYTLY